MCPTVHWEINFLKQIVVPFTDEHFPDYGKAELLFSGSSEKIQGEHPSKISCLAVESYKL